MNRGLVALVLGVGLVCGSASVRAADDAKIIQKTSDSVALASSAVGEARLAINQGKKLVMQVPADSPAGRDVQQVLLAASKCWDSSLLALSDAKKAEGKVKGAQTEGVRQDYALLSSTASKVALAGAKVVQTSISYIAAVAAKDGANAVVARVAFQDALEGFGHVEQAFDKVKRLLKKKYSK